MVRLFRKWKAHLEWMEHFKHVGPIKKVIVHEH